MKETITDDELAELEQHLEKFRKYAGQTPQILAVTMKTARMLWPDRTDDEIRAYLRSQGLEET